MRSPNQPRRKVLILGNSPQINDIDFDRLDSSIITVGVNRIWHKHYPNYFFFQDYEILTELRNNKWRFEQLRRKSTFISSDWLMWRARKANRRIPKYITIHRRIDQRKFPDSVTTCLEILANHYFPKQKHTFYIAGVSLKWQEPSHFWKGEVKTVNHNGKGWYIPRFERMYKNWKDLQTQNYNIYSVTPNSRLNNTFKYVKIENLYK